MPFEFFAVPIRDSHAEAERLNECLRRRRILTVKKELVQEGENTAWVFCVEYDEREPVGWKKNEPKVDYKEVLNDGEFRIFVRLRELRKSLAEKEAMPPYTIFTNEQLARMVTMKAMTKSDLQKIPGVGESRIGKYGDAFLKILQETSPA